MLDCNVIVHSFSSLYCTTPEIGESYLEHHGEQGLLAAKIGLLLVKVDLVPHLLAPGDD